MTTIAASLKHRTMAADSRLTYGNVCYIATKIKRLDDGSLLGMAGDTAICSQVERFIAGGERPTIADNQSFEIIILRSNVILVYANELEPVYLQDEFCAVGTGGMVALAAMRNGMTPKRSVEIAITVDVNSGGKVMTRRLK